MPPSENPTRKAGAAFAAKLAEHRNQVAGEPGVVERAAEPLGAAASPHVKAVGGKAGAQGRGAEAPHVPGCSGTFQAVHHHDFARRRTPWALRLHQHLNIRLGLKQPALNGKPGFASIALPEMAGHGLPVRIPE